MSILVDAHHGTPAQLIEFVRDDLYRGPYNRIRPIDVDCNRVRILQFHQRTHSSTLFPGWKDFNPLESSLRSFCPLRNSKRKYAGRIAGYAHEEGRCLIVVVNKWDLTDGNRKAFTTKVRDELKFLDYAPVVFVSAKEGKGTDVLFGLIREAYESASKRIGTGELNRFVATLKLDQDFKVRYITQPSIRPPAFLVFTDQGRDLHFSLERFLINRLRKEFGFKSTPVVIKAKRR